VTFCRYTNIYTNSFPVHNDLVSSEGRDFRQVDSGSISIPDHE
jgi:hypothetical protein